MIRMTLARGGHRLVLVPLAAILVAGLRLRFMEMLADRMNSGPRQRGCDVSVAKGDELGWFEHSSTIIVLEPPGFVLAEGVTAGEQLRMGRALLTLPKA